MFKGLKHLHNGTDNKDNKRKIALKMIGKTRLPIRNQDDPDPTTSVSNSERRISIISFSLILKKVHLDGSMSVAKMPNWTSPCLQYSAN